jgi:hypothetical protein
MSWKSWVPAEIQTEHLPNTNLEHYRYTNPSARRHNPQDRNMNIVDVRTS